MSEILKTKLNKIMTDYSNYTNKYIENKIDLNLKTLNSFSTGEYKQ